MFCFQQSRISTISSHLSGEKNGFVSKLTMTVYRGNIGVHLTAKKQKKRCVSHCDDQVSYKTVNPRKKCRASHAATKKQMICSKGKTTFLAGVDCPNLQVKRRETMWKMISVGRSV